MADERLPDDDAARRRDEVIKRMLATPPQPKPSPKKGKASRASDEDGRGAKPET
jgi:hypothetical protein